MSDARDTQISIQMALVLYRTKGEKAARIHLTKCGFGRNVIQRLIKRFEES